MLQMSGSGDDPRALTPTRPLTPHQQYQLNSPSITVKPPASSVNQQRLIPLTMTTPIRIVGPTTSQTLMRTSILTPHFTSTMPRTRVITTSNMNITLPSAVGGSVRVVGSGNIRMTASTAAALNSALPSALGGSVRVGGGGNIRMGASTASTASMASMASTASFTAPPLPTAPPLLTAPPGVRDPSSDTPENETEGEPPAAKRGRISRSAVHDEFDEEELFNRRMRKTVEGRRCKHCRHEFLTKNKTNLEDHLRVFHKDVYQKVIAIDNAARIQKAESLKAACEKTSLLSILFPSSEVSESSTELTKRKRKVHI